MIAFDFHSIDSILSLLLFLSKLWALAQLPLSETSLPNTVYVSVHHPYFPFDLHFIALITLPSASLNAPLNPLFVLAHAFFVPSTHIPTTSDAKKYLIPSRVLLPAKPSQQPDPQQSLCNKGWRRMRRVLKFISFWLVFCLFSTWNLLQRFRALLRWWNLSAMGG